MIVSMGQSLWRYRGFILGNVKREFQSNYRNSLLGALWQVLQPLALILVYTIVFSTLIRPRIQGMSAPYSYSVYLCAGLITWGLFQEILLGSTSTFINNGGMLQKLNFPRICLPAIVVLNALVNFFIIFCLYILFLVIVQDLPGFEILYMIPVLGIQIMFSVGLGMVAGTLNVFFRDVGQFINVILQFWFWLTPIVYSKGTLPPSVKTMVSLNPMAHFVSAYHDIFLYHSAPDLSNLWPVLLLSLFLCFLGMWLFKKKSGEMVDEL